MICGLENLGNTCYFNSILQLLMNCDDFIEFIQLFPHSSMEMIHSFQLFIKKYKDNKQISPTDIQSILKKKNIFNSYCQYDAHEFLVSFLDLLDNEIKKTQIQIYSKFFNFKYYTIIKNLSKDELKKIQSEELILTIPYSESLEKSIEIFQSKEMIENWESDMYAMKTRAEKHTEIYDLPFYFFILINRFDKNGHKIDKKMDIPLSFKRYKLKGAVIHYGIHQFGHYVSIVEKHQKYFHCDDDRINEISQDDFRKMASIAYLLLFSKK
jgi:ubiquitin carboxyl-terminal hydrolase 36/42